MKSTTIPIPKSTQEIKDAVSQNNVKKIKKYLEKFGLRSSEFSAIKGKHISDYTLLLSSISATEIYETLCTETTKMVLDYVVSVIKPMDFLKAINYILSCERSKKPQKLSKKIIKSLKSTDAQKKIVKKIEGLQSGELKALIAYIVSNPDDVEISFELIKSIMRSLQANHLVKYGQLIMLAIPYSRTTPYTS